MKTDRVFGVRYTATSMKEMVSDKPQLLRTYNSITFHCF